MDTETKKEFLLFLYMQTQTGHFYMQHLFFLIYTVFSLNLILTCKWSIQDYSRIRLILCAYLYGFKIKYQKSEKLIMMPFVRSEL